MSRLFRRHVALPAEHGAWALLVVPLLIGLFAGGRWTVLSLYVVVGAFSAFLVRHPLTLAIKAYSGRRGRDILPAAWFWMIVYGTIGALQVAGLVLRGYGYVLWLVVPGIPVLAWYLYLVSRRDERRQWGVEVLAGGALALAAPAAYWVGVGQPHPTGWLLWGLTWAQSAASLLHAYLRLHQRALDRVPEPREGWRIARPALVLTSFNFAAVLGLSVKSIVAPLLFVPYAVQWLETIQGVLRPAVGLKPKAIGYRQLLVMIVFTVLFVLCWGQGVSRGSSPGIGRRLVSNSATGVSSRDLTPHAPHAPACPHARMRHSSPGTGEAGRRSSHSRACSRSSNSPSS